MKALGKLLVKSAIIIHYPAKNAGDVVSALGGRLLKAGYVKDSFVQAALTREQSMPTGLPLGGNTNAAIPHTDVEHVLKPGVAIATLAKPVIFHNMANPEDTVEVKLVFLLALDQPKAQIEMLQEIAGVLHSADLIETLMQAKTPDDIIRALKD
jgi:galactitol PTS system EIIA component